MTAKRQFEVSTTANCRFVVKHPFKTSWETIAIGVAVWEHCDINTQNM